MSRSRMLIGVFAVSAIASSIAWAAKPGDDWPQFRGPDRTDVSQDTGLLKEWPKDGPPLVWTGKDIGEGFSSVSVVGDRVFTMGDKSEKSHVFCLSRTDGKNLWESPIGKSGGGGGYSGTRCTPTVDGDRVYGLGQFGDLVCLKVVDGSEVWRKNLSKDFKGAPGGWSYTESPLVDGDKLVCTPGGKEASVVALNKMNGEVIWKCPIDKDNGAGYSSIVIGEACGVKQYVQMMAGGLRGFDAKDGKLLWSYGTSNDRFGHNTANIPTPIVHGDFVFASVGYGRGAALVKLVKKGDQIEAEEVWFNNELKNKHGGVVMVGKYVYGDSDDSGLPWCAEWETGKRMWKKSKRTDASGSAAVTYADGNLYFRYQNDWVELVPANPDEYKVVGEFKPPETHQPCWAHPVVVGGRLYLRDGDLLYCYDVKQH